MTHTIALFNQAGGVGKTTLTMNMGYHLAERGKRVLLVDMDPQASLTVFMGLRPKDQPKTIYDALVGEDPEPLTILKQIHEMDLVPANVNLGGAERLLHDAIMRDLRLKQAIEPVQENYDFILIDCPPTLGFLSIISLMAANYVLVPVQTHYKALEGTEQVLDTIQRVRKHGNRQLSLLGVVPTMFDARASQDKMSLQSLQKGFKQTLVFPTVPRATDFANASQAHVPLALYFPSHSAVSVLREIAEAVDKKV